MYTQDSGWVLPGPPTLSRLWCRKASDQQPLGLCSVSMSGFRAIAVLTPRVRGSASPRFTRNAS